MSAAWAIWRKELAIYAATPLAYVLAAVTLSLAGLFFWLGVALTGEASLRVMVSDLAVAQLFLLPMLTMRSFAEERRQGTLELLLTCPVAPGAIVAGKWLAAVTLCAAVLAATGVFPIVLALHGDPDWGIVATSYLGLACVSGAFCAAGLFASTLSDDHVAAGLLGVVMLLPLWLVGGAELVLPRAWAETLAPFGLVGHLQSFGHGVLDTADIGYFVTLGAAFLVLATHRLETRRWR
jgi:ABC-2 type transport system permease protein